MTENPQSRPAAAAQTNSAASRRFDHVEGRHWGYAPDDVDAYFKRVEAVIDAPPGRGAPEVTSRDVRAAVFGRSRGGYQPEVVDTALDQLENTLARRENRDYIDAHGPQAWEDRVDALSDLIFGRLERLDGQRFRRPSGESTRGYAVVDVDTFCHAVVEELSAEESVHPDRVRSAVFGPAVGERAYEEQQVDAFLDKLVELLLALQ